eukprot:365711-Chlamydomonas_euryale.AAC.17
MPDPSARPSSWTHLVKLAVNNAGQHSTLGYCTVGEKRPQRCSGWHGRDMERILVESMTGQLLGTTPYPCSANCF